MPYAICIVPVSPMRFEPFHVSEMTSQVLFGESCEVIGEAYGGFIRVRTLHDGYDGFCSENQFMITGTEPGPGKLVKEWINDISFRGNLMKIPFGAMIPVLDELSFSGETWDHQAHARNEQAVRKISSTFINTPYLWGGRSVFGADCSGFVQTCFRYLGISLPRDASHQAMKGEQVGLLQEVKCGDLAFFDDPEGNIIHVGILLDESSIIHAYGKVRVDDMDNEGIINTETGNRTHQLRLIRRFF
jgi:gamma-D-glutamyl-L-lysine dipeptidyl-peptidase